MKGSRDEKLSYYRGRIDRLAADRVAEVIVELVLIERGYLDVDGWVYLQEESIREALDEINGSLVNRRSITLAIQWLLQRRVVQEVAGSRLSDGSTTYPPVGGMPKANLLRFQADRYRQWSAEDCIDEEYDFETGVYGHTRKLGPGQQASDEAVWAHREAQEQGHVANNGPLPTGYTFVTTHRRRYREHRHGRGSYVYEPPESLRLDNTDFCEEDEYHRWT